VTSEKLSAFVDVKWHFVKFLLTSNKLELKWTGIELASFKDQIAIENGTENLRKQGWH
jgi:hypothetical protein